MPANQENDTTQISESPSLLPKILLEDCSKQPEKWHELRHGKITASTMPVIAGFNPYKSPLRLWAEWTGKVKDDFKGNRFTQLGSTLEPLVASWFAEKNNLEVEYADKLYQDCELDWLLATPDYLVPKLGNVPLEIKTGNARTAYKWEDGFAPQEYLIQVIVQLRVLRKERGILTAFLGDPENLAEVPVDYDSGLFELLRESAEHFLHCVKTDTPPEAGAGDADTIRAMISRDADKTIKFEAGAEVELWVAQAKDASARASEIKKQLDAIEAEKLAAQNKIKMALGAASIGELADGRKIRCSRINIAERISAGYSYERLTLPK